MMTRKSGTRLERREFLKSAVSAAAFIAAPALIARALVSTARAAFAAERIIAVSCSSNYEQAYRHTIIKPINEKYQTKPETVGRSHQPVIQIKAAPTDNPPS